MLWTLISVNVDYDHPDIAAAAEQARDDQGTKHYHHDGDNSQATQE